MALPQPKPIATNLSEVSASVPTVTKTSQNFWSQSDGAAAIEFAFLSIPFLLLIFAILEFGLTVVIGVDLSLATSAVARQIRTGQTIASGIAVTTSNGSQLDLSDFKSAVCSHILILPTSACLSQLQVDVRPLSTFQASDPSPISGSSFNSTSMCYYSGVPGAVIEMKAYYLWPVITPILLSGLVNVTSTTSGSGTSSGAWDAIGAAEVWRNEPNPNVTNTTATC